MNFPMRQRASILMYHSVSDRSDYAPSVSLPEFERQMAYIAETGRPVISLSELLRRRTVKEPLDGAVVLTFDDGYRDNYTAALPVLKRFGFHATVFVTTDLIGKADKRNLERLSVEEIHAMRATGLIDFAPHTKTHPHLTALSLEAVRREIGESHTAIDAISGRTSLSFAYPYGGYNQEIVRIIAELGFTAALTTRSGTVHAKSDLLRLPRNAVSRTTTLQQFARSLTHQSDFDGRYKSALRAFNSFKDGLIGKKA